MDGEVTRSRIHTILKKKIEHIVRIVVIEFQMIASIVSLVEKISMLNNEKYCAKCGFKNLEADKFCGGCGVHLNPKPKKTRNFAEGFFFTGFFLVFVNLMDTAFGFDLSGNQEAIGRNTGVVIYYLMYILGGMRTLIKARRKDLKLREESDEYKLAGFWKRNTIFHRAVITVIVTIGILFGVGVYSINELAAKNATPIIEDALYGTKQSSETKLVSALPEMFKGYEKAMIEKFPATVKLDSSNVLEYDSFETKKSLNDIIGLLKTSISELERTDEILLEIKDQARGKVIRSNVSEKDKAEVLSGFDKSASNTDKSYLTQRRYKILKQTYEEMLKLYQFLLKNFGSYEIKFDENGEENIFFYSDANIEIYNQYMADIQKARQRFIEAEAALMEYTDKQLKTQGINIRAEDFKNSLMK